MQTQLGASSRQDHHGVVVAYPTASYSLEHVAYDLIRGMRDRANINPGDAARTAGVQPGIRREVLHDCLPKPGRGWHHEHAMKMEPVVYRHYRNGGSVALIDGQVKSTDHKR